ncbi:hypothetical protein [Aquimarina aggregata]|uniref:hypothetical protein n=1 Tax=Aquimarina aggregata TaxID=1642818 RepID=UPI00249378EC|nr:hypothetical protein [Aquimarina aggregata]
MNKISLILVLFISLNFYSQDQSIFLENIGKKLEDVKTTTFEKVRTDANGQFLHWRMIHNTYLGQFVRSKHYITNSKSIITGFYLEVNDRIGSNLYKALVKNFGKPKNMYERNKEEPVPPNANLVDIADQEVQEFSDKVYLMNFESDKYKIQVSEMFNVLNFVIIQK